MSVVIETTIGDFTVDLFVQERPQTCLNFLKLCKVKYYNMCLFHSITPNFLAQTGDPSGKGDGGESIFGYLKGSEHRLYQSESAPRIKHERSGLLSMVCHGEGLLGSQFVITLTDKLPSLDSEHCVFGQIVEGENIIVQLNDTITDMHHRPYQDIRITHTIVLEDPFPDPEGLIVPAVSPTHPSTKDIAYSRIPADEPLTEEYSQQELDEMVQAREAAARATILEMVGDLPDADAAPPENVLFVCKLNPVTTDHDLSIIFSRFGPVKSCEVIRDQITGNSLQYAFVEFADQTACEDAYRKMDNVLIDDRRIHVDFSQSVSKLKWKGKGRGVEHIEPAAPSREKRKNNELKEERNHRPVDTKQEREMNDVHKSNKRTERRESSRDQRREVTRDQRSESRRDPKRDSRDQRVDITKDQKRDDSRDQKKERIREHRRESNAANYSFKSEISHSEVRVVKVEPSKTGKKEKPIKKKRKASTSSSSESSSESASSSSDSTDSDYKRKKKKRRNKVLVVVKTPRKSRTHKKIKKIKGKYKKYETESDSDSETYKKKKKKERVKVETTDESSSEEERKPKKKKKVRKDSTDEEVERKKKRKRKRDDSEESEVEKVKKRGKKRKKSSEESSDSSESDERTKKKRRKIKNGKMKTLKKIKKRSRSSTSSSSE